MYVNNIIKILSQIHLPSLQYLIFFHLLDLLLTETQ